MMPTDPVLITAQRENAKRNSYHGVTQLTYGLIHLAMWTDFYLDLNVRHPQRLLDRETLKLMENDFTRCADTAKERSGYGKLAQWESDLVWKLAQNQMRFISQLSGVVKTLN